jgi:hypothetical protein
MLVKNTFLASTDSETAARRLAAKAFMSHRPRLVSDNCARARESRSSRGSQCKAEHECHAQAWPRAASSRAAYTVEKTFIHIDSSSTLRLLAHNFRSARCARKARI